MERICQWMCFIWNNTSNPFLGNYPKEIIWIEKQTNKTLLCSKISTAHLKFWKIGKPFLQRKCVTVIIREKWTNTHYLSVDSIRIKAWKYTKYHQISLPLHTEIVFFTFLYILCIFINYLINIKYSYSLMIQK